MKHIFLIFILLQSLASFSQPSVDSVLVQVERNNSTLTACRAKMEAELIGNRTGIYLSNPELEFNYLWGSPADIGHRTDISVRQSFDFPTAYRYRNQISTLRNQQAGLEYERQRKEILYQARMLCVEITYQNALKSEYNQRVENARQISLMIGKKFRSGDTGIMEWNEANIHLLTITREAESIGIEYNALMEALAGLNGGQKLTITDNQLKTQLIDEDFEQWYYQAEANHPVLQWLSQEINISRKQEKLTQAEALPKFYAGYMSEKEAMQQFQGITLGITLPLWEKKNTLRYAKAKEFASLQLQADSKLRFYNEMKIRYSKILALQNSLSSFREGLAQFSNHELLEKALEKGEISLGDYLIQQTRYYDSMRKILDMELDLNKEYIGLTWPLY